ncbi:MAG: helix-turn-helix transcriptional regulator [Candidatus Odinarchaeota archaeon]
MWLGKFLNLEDDIEELSSLIKKELLKGLQKSKLTPLEFTIIETIFNSQQLSGYDLIRNLNRHFAGTWEARSGTIYPVLRKLEKDGFLKAKQVKSPIGPLRKVYSLTEVGEQLLKYKVNKNYYDQLKFVENFLVELSSIFIHSFSDQEKSKKIIEIQNALSEIFKNVIQNIPPTLDFKIMCTKCGSEIGREVAYCPNCGESLFQENYDDK